MAHAHATLGILDLLVARDVSMMPAGSATETDSHALAAIMFLTRTKLLMHVVFVEAATRAVLAATLFPIRASSLIDAMCVAVTGLLVALSCDATNAHPALNATQS